MIIQKVGAVRLALRLRYETAYEIMKQEDREVQQQDRLDRGLYVRVS